MQASHETKASAPIPKYIRVMSIAPTRSAGATSSYRVHGHQFDNNWRVYEVGNADTFGGQIEMISTKPFVRDSAAPNAAPMPSTYDEVMKNAQPRKVNPKHPRSDIAPPMLAVLPATEEDLKEYLANTTRKLDRVEELEAALVKERAARADTEARLTRLEAATRPAVDPSKEKPAKG